MECFLDGSGTGASDVYVLAGYIATPSAWKDFSCEWSAELRSQNIECFKMTEQRHSLGRVEKFYRIIERFVAARVSCIVYVPDLVRAADATNWPDPKFAKQLKRPHIVAATMLYGAVFQSQEETLGIVEPIQFVLDDEQEKHEILNREGLRQVATPLHRQHLVGEPISYRDDKTNAPLQAADLYAWWIRQWAVTGVWDGFDVQPYPWKKETGIVGLNIELDEEALRFHFDGMRSLQTQDNASVARVLGALIQSRDPDER